MRRIATIGFFDGVHKGHRYLFKQLNEEAAARGLKPLIVTFEEHPRTVLQSDYIPKLLSTKEERKALLSAYGEVVMLRFSTIRDLTAEQFMIRLKEEYGVEVLLMGYDHRFGSDGLRNPEDYCRVGAKQGIEVLRMEEYQDGTQHVSSTEIRTALEKGDVERAKELLGRPYALFGKVVPFRFIRIVSDLICTLIGFLLGLMPGIGTVITALFMGPLITFFRQHLSDPLLNRGKTT